MSWDAYVTNMTTAGAHYCGVYTQTGIVCAQSSNCNVSAAEINLIKSCFEKNGSKLDINNIPCFMIKSDDVSVTGKSKNPVGDSKVLFHCEFTNTLIIIVGMTGANERSCSGIASGIATYLKTLGH